MLFICRMIGHERYLPSQFILEKGMNEEVVGIFNTDWQLLGYVVLSEEGLSITAVHEVPNVAQWVLQQLQERDAQLQKPLLDEDGCAIGLQTVVRGEERYLEAVRDELRRVSIRAHIIDKAIVNALTHVSAQGFDASIRTQVVSQIIGLDAEHALVALEAVLGSGVSKEKRSP